MKLTDSLLGIRRNERGNATDIDPLRIVGVIGSIIILAILALSSFVIVPVGFNGVVFNIGTGIRATPLASGFHIIVPFVESVTMMEIRTQLVERDASAASKDLQVVSTKVALNYRPVETATPNLFKEVGLSYSERLIEPAIQESVKAVTAKYNADELITERETVKQNIKDALIARLSIRDILVDEISITNFDFSPQFNAAIEAKVTAQQKALEAERVLQQIKIEKEQTITKAEAEAASIRLKADAEAYALQVIREQLEKNNALIQYKAIEKWTGELPRFTGSTIPFVNVQEIE